MTLEQRVLAAIADGRWHVLGLLANALGTSRRSVEEAVESLRLSGQPIIGGNEGIRLSDSSSEVRSYAQDRRRRLVSISKGTRALLHTARRMDGPQTKFWEDAA